MVRSRPNTGLLSRLAAVLAGAVAVWLCGCSVTQSPAAEKGTDAAAKKQATTEAVTGSAAAADWPHFLGPNYDDIAPVTMFDPKGLKQLWTQELGPGCSSVTIVEGRLFTMGNRDDRDIVYCLDPKTGEENWTFGYDCELMPKLYAGGPNCTPTIAGGRVYTLSRQGHIYCLDAQTGKEIWGVSQAKWSPGGAWWGFSDSPVVWGDKVFVNLTNKGLALERDTGKVVWSGDEAVAGYASILPLPEGNPVVDGRALAVQTCRTLHVVDPDTGKSMLEDAPEWALRTSNNNAVSPKVYDGDLLFMHGSAGLSRISREGDNWSEKWLCADLMYDPRGQWFTFNRQVIRGNHLYAICGRGKGSPNELKCVNLDSGKVEWAEPEAFGNLILAADKLMIITEMGEIAWGALQGNEYKETFRERPLNGGLGDDEDGLYWSHPVLHDGHLYARSNKGKLTCFQVE